jgi:hypothetical protein
MSIKMRGDLGVPMISLVGAAGAGKDTVADFLVDRYHATKYASGDPIKRLAIESYGMTEAMCFTHEGKAAEHPYLRGHRHPETGELFCLVDDTNAKLSQTYVNAFGEVTPVTNREVLEILGDKMCAVDKLVLMRPMVPLHARTGKTVVDVATREEAQAEFVRAHGGVVVYVANQAKEAEAGAHHSATFFRRTEHDYRLDNDGTLEDLAEAVDTLVQRLAERPRRMRAA